MKTIVKPVSPEAIAEAADIIKAGGLVGMPTETVYGLGADALNEEAVLSIFAAKERPADNPLIVHVSSLEEIAPLVSEIPEGAKLLMEAFWPGPMTLILPKSERISSAVSAGLNTVGIRMPASDAARALIRASGTPIAAPSANRSGKPSPTTAQHVFEDMDGRIPMILDGGECEVGVESSVIDATGETPIILRPGGITPEMVKDVLGSCDVDEHVMSPLKEGELVRSPGMKHRHYSPEAKTAIYEGAAENVIAAICAAYDEALQKDEKPCILGFDEHDFGERKKISLGSENAPREAAKRLFAALRELDERGETVALCEAVEPTGIGLAVMNRMGRAAGFDLRRV